LFVSEAPSRRIFAVVGTIFIGCLFDGKAWQGKRNEKKDGGYPFHFCLLPEMHLNLKTSSRSKIEYWFLLTYILAPPLPGKTTPLQPDHYHPTGGLMEQSKASLKLEGEN
jgi:hypothetical protein